MCYIGKATKIFIFIITVLVITGILIGFTVLRHTIHPKSHKCSGDSCYQSDFYPPPPSPEIPISTNPSDPTSNPSPFPPPPPPSSGSSSNLSPPPPPTAASLASPPSGSSANQTPPPPPTPVVISAPPPPTPVVIPAPPPVFNPPSPVPVTPGPVNSS
ncbi:hypothetical protein L6452_15794 [Arctium lappa]|uniref:Uncharacterized protein n=1 Tax=Arctium lappa TaxID=4217 RepID=A0ACB9CPV1_ARCLA|nr:hypothetical protein L6452_15794 [Arctium lappa]